MPETTPAAGTADPLVTVVIPTYNQASYLREAIDSVLAQTYPAIEVIVVDDGSTDETAAVLRSYGERIRAIHQENHGAAHALNRGIREATGEFVCWLSSDDAFLPDKVALQVDAFAADPGLGLCFTGFDTIDAAGAFRADRSDIPLLHPDLFVSVFRQTSPAGHSHRSRHVSAISRVDWPRLRWLPSRE